MTISSKSAHHTSHSRQTGHTLRGMLLRHPAWSVAAIIVVAFNLRPAITGVAPFIGDIRHDLGISGLGISILTMAPVICLGLFGPAAPPLARRFGTEAVVLASLLLLAAGITLRSFGTVPLFLGTVVNGAAMSMLGVLSPVLIKRDFPHKVGLMTGLFAVLIGLGAAASTASAVPLKQAFEGRWEMALLAWALPALVGAVVFIPQLFRYERIRGVATPHVRGLLRSPLAWQVTGFFALVAALVFAAFTWAPAMIQARGLGAAESGVVVSICYIAQMVTGLVIPIIAGRRPDQRLIGIVVIALTAIGLLGFIFAPVWSLTIFSIILGLGQGGAFALALLLIVLRASDQHVAAQLSSLAQTVGFVVGGVAGPFAVGVIHDRFQSWPAVAIFFAVVAACALVLALGAGRAKTVTVQLHHR